MAAVPPISGAAGPADQLQIVRLFLERRGLGRALAAFDADVAANAAAANGTSSTAAAGAIGSSINRPINVDEFATRNAPAANTRSQTATAQNLSGAANNNTTAKKDDDNARWRNSIDFAAWDAGFKSLTAFCLGSLSLHRAELSQVLWPIFVHIYLELVLTTEPISSTPGVPPSATDIALAQRMAGAAEAVMQHYGHHFQDLHYTEIRQLRTVKLAEHVKQSPLAQRWRSERYILPISERGWGLLQSWLAGGGLLDNASTTAASNKGTTNPQMGDRGRDKVLAIINERIQLRVTKQVNAVTDAPSGLLYDLLPEKSANANDRIQTAATKLDLPNEPIQTTIPPRDAKLEKEINRVLKDANEPTITVAAVPEAEDSTEAAAGLPYPSGFKVADVKREVEKVREGRKRIRLGPEAFNADGSLAALEGRTAGSNHARPGGVFNPSVCMFTVHDSNDGLIGTTLSQDSTLLACGFSDSYIKLWNLKGEKFRPYRSDFELKNVKDASSLKRLRAKEGSSTIKLVGHSGPVYALAFDPLAGASAPPKHLLSCSSDTTVRLWSTETCSNLVAYRGHRDAVWDVQWGPKGVYFATASRDRTARIWTTERTKPLRMMAGHLSDVDCVTFHPNSMYLATGSSDRTCRLWDVQRGVCVRVFVGHQGGISCITISPDGRYLASAADDLAINLWDLASGKLVKSMKGHTARINSLAFSMESTVLLSGSTDNTIRIWDVEAQRKEAVLSGLDLKNLGLTAEGFSGLKSTSAISLSDSLRGDGNSSATLGVLPKSAFADEDPSLRCDLF